MDFTDRRSAALSAIEDAQYDEAVRLIDELLAEEPDDATAVAVKALCLLELRRGEDAVASARRAARLDPFIPYVHWVLGLVLAEQGRLDEAEAAAGEALRLDPDDPDHHALLAQVAVRRGRWPEALAHAERGSAADPSHGGSRNLRALALRQLGRLDEAERLFAEGAAADPLDPVAAAGKGWSALGHGRTAEADEAFRHALLFDPTSEWARAGLLTTMKARSPVYRVLLRYFMWMSRRSRRDRLLIMVGAVVGYNVLRSIARSIPALEPLLLPLLVTYALFALLTWVADPLLDFALGFDAEGRRLLDHDRLWGGRLVGGGLLLALASLVVSAFTGGGRPLSLAVGLAAFAIPASAVFNCRRGWPRRTMGLYTAGLGVLLVAGAATPDDATARACFGFAFLGSVLGSWVGAWLTSVDAGS